MSEKNSSGINGWLTASDNDSFPFHTFVKGGKGGKCKVCGLILYKSVHAETAESERRRKKATAPLCEFHGGSCA